MSGRPLRVLHLSHVVRDWVGGAAGASLHLNATLRALGHEVTEVFADDMLPPSLGTRVARERVPVEAMRIALAQFGNYDVIEITGHAGWLAFPGLRARRVGSKSKPLLVARSYGLEHFDHEVRRQEHRNGERKLSLAYRLGGGFLTLRQVELSVLSADLWAVPRPGAATWANKRHLKSPRQTLCTGWGVDQIFLDAKPDPIPGRIAWLGTTVERKGWRYFVAAFTEAARVEPSLTLTVFGSDQIEDRLLEEFPEDLRDRVRWNPKLGTAELIDELRTCSTFVSTSLSEGYHLATLQAMAVGVPVIATREGFLGDLSGAERDMFWEIPKARSRELADALVTAARQGTSSHMADQARSYAANRSWRTVAEATVVAYRKGLADLRTD